MEFVRCTICHLNLQTSCFQNRNISKLKGLIPKDRKKIKMKCFVCKNEGASKCKKDNKTLLKKLHQENEMLKLIKNFKV